MKRFLLILVGFSVMLLTLSNSGCNEVKKTQTADAIEKVETEKIMKEATKQVGMPNIDKFTQKKLLKMIYELQDDENLICHAYLANEMHKPRCFMKHKHLLTVKNVMH
jgi:hypothetical protein